MLKLDDLSNLVDFVIKFGANGKIPFIIIEYGTSQYNILSFLENETVLNAISFLKEFMRVGILFTTFIEIVQNLPLILDGDYKIHVGKTNWDYNRWGGSDQIESI